MAIARKRQARRCKASRSDGTPCRAWAILGGTVCTAHGGSAPQVRAEARVRHWEARIKYAVDQAYDRWQRELTDWEARRILGAASVLGIDPADVTAGDLLWCVVEYGLPGTDTMPRLRVDGRYGPRTRAQLAARAARQGTREAAQG